MQKQSFPLTVISGEPRVYDITLGERLGFDRPINIRNMIKRNMDKLQTFGPLSIVERVINGGNAREFYLNQKQSIFICMKSETDKAFDVQADIVRVFDAYLNGDLKTPATLATQTRMYFAATRIARNLEFARSVGGRAAMYEQLRAAHQQLGLPPIMPLVMFGKPADQGGDQMPLEV
jgi:hypothetical protein